MKATDLHPDFRALLDERKRTMALFALDHRPVVMVAIYRTDLEMPAEKMAAQTGHAFDELGHRMNAETAAWYRGTGHGTKLLFHVKNLGQLQRAYAEAKEAGFPVLAVCDRSHVLPPHFDGEPVITAIGIGPVFKDQVRDITKRCSMHRAPAAVSTIAATA